MSSLALEQRKHRRTVLFGIGLQLRRIYGVAEREPIPDRIVHLLDKLDDGGARSTPVSAKPGERA